MEPQPLAAATAAAGAQPVRVRATAKPRLTPPRGGSSAAAAAADAAAAGHDALQTAATGSCAARPRVVVSARSRWKKAGVGVSAASRAAQAPSASSAASKIGLLLAAEDGAAREAAYRALEATTDARLAAACVRDLVGVLGSSADEIGAAEFQRCSLVLSHVISLDAVAVGAAYMTSGRWLVGQTTGGNALDVLLSKPLGDLGRADVLCAAAELSCHSAVCAKGWAAPAAGAGLSPQQFLNAWREQQAFFVSRSPDAARNVRLSELALEVLRSDAIRAKLPEALVAGLWGLIGWGLMARPVAASGFIKAGGVEVAIRELRAASSGSADWVSVSASPHNRFGMIALTVLGVGSNNWKQLGAGHTGLVDVLLEALSANTTCSLEDVNVSMVWLSLRSLSGLAFESETLETTQLRSMAPCLRYILDNELHWDVQTTAFPALTLAALPFGRNKDRELPFGRNKDRELTAVADGDSSEIVLELTQRDVDAFVQHSISHLDAEFVGGAMALEPAWSYAALNLLASDAHKLLLMNNAAALIKLLKLGLFVDEYHPMGLNAKPPTAPTPASVQAIFQQSYAEAIVHFVHFQPGRDALLRDGSLPPLLEILAERGLSKEAQEHARTALVALGTSPVHLQYVSEDQAAFERRVDPLITQTGDRGKPSQFSLIPEAVPPTLALESTSYSPSMQASPTPSGSPNMQQHAVADYGVGDMMSFFERQQMQMERRMQLQQDDFRKQHKEMEERLVAMEGAMSPTVSKEDAISDAQLAALQERVRTLHASGQLSGEERFCIEDLCGDYVELQAAVGVVTSEMLAVTCGTRQWHTFASVGQLHAVVMLSEKLAADETFTRQLRRKLVVV